MLVNWTFNLYLFIALQKPCRDSGAEKQHHQRPLQKLLHVLQHKTYHQTKWGKYIQTQYEHKALVRGLNKLVRAYISGSDCLRLGTFWQNTQQLSAYFSPAPRTPPPIVMSALCPGWMRSPGPGWPASGSTRRPSPGGHPASLMTPWSLTPTTTQALFPAPRHRNWGPRWETNYRKLRHFYHRRSCYRCQGGHTTRHPQTLTAWVTPYHWGGPIWTHYMRPEPVQWQWA